MSTGWSVNYGASQDSGDAGQTIGSSNSASIAEPPLKRMVLGRVPAAPVIVASSVTEVAEGNLVQGTIHVHDSDSEHMSHVSIASSNKAQIIRAKLDLERALLREKQQETRVRRMEAE